MGRVNIFIAFGVFSCVTGTGNANSLAACKINNIALVVDSTDLVNENRLSYDFTKMTTILYKTIIGVYEHLGINAKVSGRVYHTNEKCGEELSFEEGEYFDPVSGVDSIFQHLLIGSGLTYHESSASFNVSCAEWLLFSQYELFDVCDQVRVSSLNLDSVLHFHLILKQYRRIARPPSLSPSHSSNSQ